MNRGREEIVSKLKKFFRERADEYNIELVFLYGSWARGLPRKNSDIDLAVVFSSKVESGKEEFSRITDISYKLSISLKKEVNIIVIEEDFSKPMLYYNAIILGIPVFTKDVDNFLRLKLETIYQMEDFQIFAAPWQLEIANKLLRR